MVSNRVRLSLSWEELGAARAQLGAGIRDAERAIANGWRDEYDHLGHLKLLKAKLDRPFDRLMASLPPERS